MASVETTLSSPLLRAPYEQLYTAFTSPPLKPRTETERLAKMFLKLPGVPAPSSLVMHQSTHNPILFHLGEEDTLLNETLFVSLTTSLIFLKKYFISLETGMSMILGESTGLSRVNIEPAHILTKGVILAFARAMFWTNLVETSVAAARARTWLAIGKAFCCRRFTVINVPSIGFVVLSHDAVLMMKDLTYSHFLIHLYTRLDSERLQVSSLLSSFTEWGLRVLSELGDAGYGLIKGVEALTIVRMIDVSEKWLDSAVQAQEMVEKYINKEIDAGGTGGFTRSLWARITSLTSTSLLAEYFGFMKLLGHPYVDPRAGVEKVKKLVFEPPPKSSQACEELGFSVCHLYTRGYLEKTGNWPPLVFHRSESSPPTRLELLFRHSQPTLAPGFSQYEKEDWRTTSFSPHLEFDMGEDILSLLSDKALSYKRQEFDAVWYGKLDYTPPKPTTSKRVLLDFLRTTEFNLREITQQVMDRTVPQEHYICSQSPKEREMKWDAPRMFVKFTGPIRAFFNNVEKNTKKGPFQYFKEQTMTMNRQELLKRFLTTTSEKGSRWVDLHIGIDFSSWNLCWDSQNHSTPTGVRLDEIFGTPGVHTFCHEFFSQSLSVLDNSDYPPVGLTRQTRDAVLAGHLNLDTVYTGHDKGYEGIQQGGWTLSTIGMTHQAIHDLGVPFSQSGQGDNQVFTFHVYIDPTWSETDIRSHLRKLCDEILTRLSVVAKSLGHEIKPEECNCSTSLFAYGKELFVDGKYCPATTKYISRIFPTTTADTPSFYEYISSVSSGGIAATDKSNNSLPIMALTKLIEHITLTREMKRSMLHDTRLSINIQLAVGPNVIFRQIVTDLLCIIPSNVGGLPTSAFLEFLYRGHSDPLSSSIASLYTLRSFPGVDEYLKVLSRSWIYKKEPTLEGLILDPYALPISGSSPPAVRVAHEVRPLLIGETRNTLIKDVFTVSSDGDRQGLFEWLGSCTPMYPKILHDLYKSSSIGLVDALCRRFTNTRTLVSMTSESGINLGYISLKSDFAYIDQVIRRVALVFKIGTGDDKEQTARHTDDGIYYFVTSLRDRWGCGSLEGVTNIHPLFSGRILRMPQDVSSLCGDREIVVMSEFSSSAVCQNTRGPISPYMGSKTGDKTVGKWIKPIDTSPPFQDVVKILTIQSMTAVPDTPYWESLDNLASSRCTLPLDLLREFCRIKVGGTLAHRWLTRDDAQGSFVNISINWPSHLTVSSNHAGALGLLDYPFDFQEAITLLQGLITWWKFGIDSKPPFGLVLQVNTSLMQPVEDHIVNSEQLVVHHINPFPSYYVNVSTLRVSSRATSAALLADHQPLDTLLPTIGDPKDSLRMILLLHICGNLAVGSKHGRVLGAVSYQRIIDMPELSKITSPIFRQALAEAIHLKIALPASLIANKSTRELENVVAKLYGTEIRRAIPSLYGTIKELDNQQALGADGLGLGHAESPRTLAYWMSSTYLICMTLRRRLSPNLYLRGPSSISRALISSLGSECLLLLRHGSMLSWQAGKQLAEALQSIGRLPDETTKIYSLLHITHELGLQRNYIKVLESPTEILRRYRTDPPEAMEPIDGFCRYSSTLSLVYPRGPTPLDRKILITPYRPPYDHQITSWRRKETISYEPGVLWCPLSQHFTANCLEVLLVGVGDGYISHGLNPTWRVTGLDLGKVLASQAHSMVNYRPPHMKNSFQLHNISWAMGGDITDLSIQQYLLGELKNGAYDLVILDIDGVPILQRLEIRQLLATSGVPCFTKVLVHPSNFEDICNSFLSYRQSGDLLWASRAYPANELCLGGSSAPIGLVTSAQSLAGDTHLAWVPRLCADTIQIAALPPYDWPTDFYMVTGDFPGYEASLPSVPLCRTLSNYTRPGETYTLSLLAILLERGCPKSRVRALYRLYSTYPDWNNCTGDNI